MYICLCVYMYVYICICIHLCISVYVNICAWRKIRKGENKVISMHYLGKSRGVTCGKKKCSQIKGEKKKHNTKKSIWWYHHICTLLWSYIYIVCVKYKITLKKEHKMKWIMVCTSPLQKHPWNTGFWHLKMIHFALC